MSEAVLEHVNVTVRDLDASAGLLRRLFGWKLRWEGEAILGGRSAHVGGEHSYVALYEHADKHAAAHQSYFQINGLNHLAVVVDDLDAVEAQLEREGLRAHSHGDYEPGRRFYFQTADGLEVEVLSYR